MSAPTDIQARFTGRLDKFELDAELTIPGRGVTALFGQSGCGKTTVLRCLAGLTRMPGRLQVGDAVWQDDTTFLPPHKRPIGYVFQEASLFPHLSVHRNLMFGRMRLKKPVECPVFEDITELLGLTDLLDRAPRHLSGGERQRVAIGRALLCAPRLLLMDEPLSALDRFSKDEIIPYLETLHDTLSIPMVFISHDTDEVERLADHLVLLKQGRVRAAGPLLDMLADPTLFIARSAKTASVLEARVAGLDTVDNITELAVPGGRILLPGRVADIGQRRRIRIAATDVSLAVDQPSRTTILNVLPATIAGIHTFGEGRVNVVLALGDGTGARLIARITTRSLNSFGFTVGQAVYAQVKGVSMVERRRVTS